MKTLSETIRVDGSRLGRLRHGVDVAIMILVVLSNCDSKWVLNTNRMFAHEPHHRGGHLRGQNDPSAMSPVSRSSSRSTVRPSDGELILGKGRLKADQYFPQPRS